MLKVRAYSREEEHSSRSKKFVSLPIPCFSSASPVWLPNSGLLTSGLGLRMGAPSLHCGENNRYTTSPPPPHTPPPLYLDPHLLTNTARDLFYFSLSPHPFFHSVWSFHVVRESWQGKPVGRALVGMERAGIKLKKLTRPCVLSFKGALLEINRTWPLP